MADHPIQGLMKTAMESIKDMVDVNTIIGDAVETPDGCVIIPVSRVSFGFAAGGGEYEPEHCHKECTLPFGGGSGAGVSVKPVGFLVVGHGDVRLLPVEGNTAAVERVIDLVPDIIDRIKRVIRGDCQSDKAEELAETAPTQAE